MSSEEVTIPSDISDDAFVLPKQTRKKARVNGFKRQDQQKDKKR